MAASFSYVFALGRVEPRFPSLAVEKELAQATGRAGTAELTTGRRFTPSCPSDRIDTWRGNHAGS